MRDRYHMNETVYFIRSNLEVVEGKIIGMGAVFYTIVFQNGYQNAGIRLKAHRIFNNRTEAEQQLKIIRHNKHMMEVNDAKRTI